MKDGYSVYKRANVDTADQGKLILIAYDVAIKSCKKSLELFDNHKQIEERTKHLLKVQDALSELMGSLKLDTGEIAGNLYRLYEYMIRRIIRANSRHESECVKEVIKYLESLKSAWEEAVLKVKEEKISTKEGEGLSDMNFAITG